MKRFALLTLEYPPFLGGIASYYQNWFGLLKPEEFIVIVPDTLVAAKNETNVVRLPFFAKYFWPHWLVLIWRTARVCRQEKIKYLWVPHILPLGEVAFFLKIFFGYQYIVAFHGTDAFLIQQSAWKKFLSRIICRLAYEVVATSQHTAEMVSTFTRQKITVLTPCLSLALPPALKQPKQNIIVSVARLVPEKGIDLGLVAAAHLYHEFKNFKYIVVGAGREKEKLLKLVDKLGLQPVVEFVESKSVAEAHAYYEVAKVMLVPSVREAFGIVALEAAWYGVPVVASSVGGLVEAVKENKSGFLVHPAATKVMAQKLRQVLEMPEPDYLKLVVSAQAWAKEFSCERSKITEVIF
ncbi:MAG: glycosyltransferase family 4 protein [Candidatus Buchananbacteria bacterium]